VKAEVLVGRCRRIPKGDNAEAGKGKGWSRGAKASGESPDRNSKRKKLEEIRKKMIKWNGETFGEQKRGEAKRKVLERKHARGKALGVVPCPAEG